MAGRDQAAYPDVSVICGQIDLDPDDKSGHTVLNPRLIVEVLSESTEAYDRGDKFAAYRAINSHISRTARSIPTMTARAMMLCPM